METFSLGIRTGLRRRFTNVLRRLCGYSTSALPRRLPTAASLTRSHSTRSMDPITTADRSPTPLGLVVTTSRLRCTPLPSSADLKRQPPCQATQAGQPGPISVTHRKRASELSKLATTMETLGRMPLAKSARQQNIPTGRKPSTHMMPIPTTRTKSALSRARNWKCRMSVVDGGRRGEQTGRLALRRRITSSCYDETFASLRPPPPPQQHRYTSFDTLVTQVSSCDLLGAYVMSCSDGLFFRSILLVLALVPGHLPVVA